MWQQKQENTIIPGPPCTPRNLPGPHGGYKILQPPPGNYDVEYIGGSSRKRKSTDMDQRESTPEYVFQQESDTGDARSRMGLNGQGNNHGVYLNQSRYVGPVNFGHQFDSNQHHYQNHFSETRPTYNVNLPRTGIANFSNASYSTPLQSSQHRGLLPQVKMPFEESHMLRPQQPPSCYSFGQTEAHRSFHFLNQNTEKSQAGANFQDVTNLGNKNYVAPERFFQPNRFSDGFNARPCSQEDKKSEILSSVKESGPCSINTGIGDQHNQNNRLLETKGLLGVGSLGDISESKEQSNGDQDIKVKEVTVALDTEKSKCSLTSDISSKSEGSNDNNIDVNGQKINQSKSPSGKGTSTAAEKLWDGSLQLSTSVTVSAVAFFKSGEKLLGTDWSEFVEVKGKVRLEAFEKYIQDLPRSRNRGLMVISICWKEGSPITGLSGMKEVARGYKKGSRVGVAQLSPGVDIYICPRSDTIITIIAKYGFYKGMAAIEDNPDSLIGCVVWKKNRTPLNSVAEKVEIKSNSALEQPINSPSGSSNHQVAEKTLSPTKPSQLSNQYLPPISETSTADVENAKESGTGSKNIESSEVQDEVGAEQPKVSLEIQNPAIPLSSNVTNQTTPTSDDDDLPEYDFGISSGISVTPMSKPLDVAALDRRLPAEETRNKDRPVLLPSMPVEQTISVSKQRSDNSSIPKNPSAPNQPPLKKDYELESHKPVFRTSEEKKVVQTKNSFDELPKKKNVFDDGDDDDDDDDLPEWSPPELHKQPLGGAVRPSSSLSNELSNPTFQNIPPDPPRAHNILPGPPQSQNRPSGPPQDQNIPPGHPRPHNIPPGLSQAPNILPGPPRAPNIPQGPPRVPLPSPSSSAFSYQTFRPAFVCPTTITVRAPQPMPLGSDPRPSTGFNFNPGPRPQSGSFDVKHPFQSGDRRGWRP